MRLGQPEVEALAVARKTLVDNLLKESVTAENDGQVDQELAPPPSTSSRFGAEQNELVEYDQFIALPREILSLYRQVHNASYMGLLPELGRAWITIDNRLYLWNYESPEQFTEYEGIDDSDVIVSVSLSSPKAGVFLDTIDYVLVVATLSEVSLFAITKGSDGSLAEMVYATEQSIWKMLSFGSGGGESDSRGKGKSDFCQLVKHGYWDSRLMRFIPSFIRPPETTLELRDALADMTVDNFRRMLYCVSGLGNLSAFCLSEKQGGFRRVGGSGKIFKVLTLAKEWLGRKLGLLPGGKGAGAKKRSDTVVRPARGTGRGDVDGSGSGDDDEGEEDEEKERYMSRCFGPATSTAPLRVVGLHAVPILESRDVHLVCTTNTGTRILLQLQVPDGVPFDVAVESRGPSKVEVVQVHAPPVPSPTSSSTRSGSTSTSSASSASNGGIIDGFVHRTLSAHGVYLASYVATRSNYSDMLCTVRSARLPLGPGMRDAQGSEEEKVGAGHYADTGKRQSTPCELGGPVTAKFHSVIRDIREECAAVIGSDASLRLHLALSTSSAMPPQGPSTGLEPEQILSLTGALLPSPAQEGGGTSAGASAGASARSLFRASELLTQCQARPSTISARRFLCLESQGLHVLVKQRPVDRMLGVLMSCLPLPGQGQGQGQEEAGADRRQSRGGFGFDDSFMRTSEPPHHHASHSAQAVRALVSEYGGAEFACMAVSLCCGLPADSRLSSSTPSARNRDALHPTDQNLSDPERFREELLPSFVVTTQELQPAHLDDGTRFVASAVSRGISLFVSRLLRALWEQPLLDPQRQADPLRPPCQANPNPALNPLWSEEVLSCTLQPLARLQTFMAEFLPQSRSTVPRTAAQQEELLSRHAEFMRQHQEGRPHAWSVSSTKSSTFSDSGKSRRDSMEVQHVDSNVQAHAVYGAANVTRELEHSHLACTYLLVTRARELLHLLLVVVTWHRQQLSLLSVLQRQVQETASEAAEQGIVGPRSLELALLRDRTVRSASRKRALLSAFQWTRLEGSTFAAVVSQEAHAQSFSSVVREGLHAVCRVEEAFSRDEAGSEGPSQAEEDASLWSLTLIDSSSGSSSSAEAGSGGEEDAHPPDVSAKRLATLFAQHGASYFQEGDVHEFTAFRHLSAQLSGMRNKHGAVVRPWAGVTVDGADMEAMLHPKIAPHLLAAAATWDTLGHVRDDHASDVDSLLGLHVAMLSVVGSNDALELIVEACLTAAKNFAGQRGPFSEAESALNAEGATCCYRHLVTMVCTTDGITLEQRAGMLMRALADPVLGTDPALLEVLCEGLRGRYTDDLLLNLPTEYVGAYLARRDKGLLFEWHSRRDEYVEACALKLEQAFEDNGSAIAARIGHLRDALSVVPPEEHAVVDRMLRFAVIQQDAHLRLLSMDGTATAPPSASSSSAFARAASAAATPRGRAGRDEELDQQHYWDASPERVASPAGSNKTPRTSLSPGKGSGSGSDRKDGSPGGMIRARDQVLVLEHARYRLGFTLISEGEWYSTCFSMTRDLNLWEANLCLLVLLDADRITGISSTVGSEGEALMIRLWKSFIYRWVPTHSRDGPLSQVSQFLARQRRVSEIDVDPHEQLRSGDFEDYLEWLPGLKEAIQELCLKIDSAGSATDTDAAADGLLAVSGEAAGPGTEAGPSHVSVPLAPLLAELEAIASELDIFENKADHLALSGEEAASQHGTLRGWVPDALLAVHIRKVHVVRAYVHLFWSVGRGFAPEKIIKLLESLSYVLLAWLSDSASDVEGLDRNTQDMRGAVRSQELDNWMDTLRHQLSDMSGRALGDHSRAALGRVHIEFQQLLQLIDQFAFD